MPGRSRHKTLRAAQRRRRSQKRKGGNVKFNIEFIQPDGTIIPVDGQHLTKRQTQSAPHVDFFHEDFKGFVVVMYDNDAPVPAKIHWLYVVYNNNVTDFFRYQPPNPPKGEVHTYTIELLTKQNVGWGIWGIVPEPPFSRDNFNIEEFKRVNGLELESKKTFTCGTIEQGIRMPSAIAVQAMRETPIQPSRSHISGVRMSPLPMANLSAIELNTSRSEPTNSLLFID
jgi:hypothetical protein